MNQYMLTERGDDDGQADDQEYSEAERAVLEQRDSVEPLLDYSGHQPKAKAVGAAIKSPRVLQVPLMTKQKSSIQRQVLTCQDILFSIMNHALMCIMPNTQQLIIDSRDIIKQSQNVHFTHRKDFI